MKEIKWDEERNDLGCRAGLGLHLKEVFGAPQLIRQVVKIAGATAFSEKPRVTREIMARAHWRVELIYPLD